MICPIITLQPIYHPLNDCGDHVVVINSKDVALIGREWQLRVYFHHVGYPKAYGGGPKWIPAWLLHSRDTVHPFSIELFGVMKRPRRIFKVFDSDPSFLNDVFEQICLLT